MVEIGEEQGKSLAAPFIFLLVVAFQFASRYIEVTKKKKGSVSDTEQQLQADIRQLLKEANSLTQPATFAQAAKLRRIAAAKEKDLTKSQELHNKVIKSSYNSSKQILMVLKVVSYVLLILWFWRNPVAAVSEQLVQPFGKVLSWKGGGSLNGNVRVGIIPWLIVSSRVGKYFCEVFYK